MMSRNQTPWSVPVRLNELLRIEQPMKLSPDEATRALIAKSLELEALPRFSAEVRLTQWLDGVELKGRWSADVTYRCGISLDLFDDTLEGEVFVRAVPPESPAAVLDDTGEVELSLESEDPPDVLEEDLIDVGAYLVEHLALAIDPFPRKPGAVFEAPPAEEPPSPFAVLKMLKPGEGEKT